MSEIEKLTQYFSRFPGIGARQARRFVYFLLSGNPEFAEELAVRIKTLVSATVQCSECRRYFESQRENTARRCDICGDVSRDGMLIVVEKDVDLVALQRNNLYHGHFFVLGSLIPLREIKQAIAPRINELKEKIRKSAEEGMLKEVVLALNATPEGDHTALELKILLAPLQKKNSFAVSVLGRGLSTGSELEYADAETLKSALENRRGQ